MSATMLRIAGDTSTSLIAGASAESDFESTLVADRFDVDAFINSILGSSPTPRDTNRTDDTFAAPPPTGDATPFTVSVDATMATADPYWRPLLHAYGWQSVNQPVRYLGGTYTGAVTGYRGRADDATRAMIVSTGASRRLVPVAYSAAIYNTGASDFGGSAQAYEDPLFGPVTTWASAESSYLDQPRLIMLRGAVRESRPTTPAAIRERFNQLAGRWSEETELSSVHSKAILHRAYQQIIALGPVAVPLILERLRDQPDHWFWALTILTDENPASAASSFTEARDAWLDWGATAGYLE